MSRREPGYRPEPKLYRMVFEDHPGLVVRARSTSAGAFLGIADLADIANPEDPATCKALFEQFADVLVSWNLVHNHDGPPIDPDDPDSELKWRDGDPVPTTLGGLLTQDFDLVLTMIQGWMEAVAGVPAPLVQPSTDGKPSLVESLPMEPRSQSRVS